VCGPDLSLERCRGFFGLLIGRQLYPQKRGCLGCELMWCENAQVAWFDAAELATRQLYGDPLPCRKTFNNFTNLSVEFSLIYQAVDHNRIGRL
jgi:xanthosine utilization system XapX-like protein